MKFTKLLQYNLFNSKRFKNVYLDKKEFKKIINKTI